MKQQTPPATRQGCFLKKILISRKHLVPLSTRGTTNTIKVQMVGERS